MSLDANPFYSPGLFPNLATVKRPPRVRDVKSGGTHQGDPETLWQHLPCSIQQESNDPLMASEAMARGIEARTRIYFPLDPDAPTIPTLQYQDVIVDERGGSPGYIVDEAFDVGGTGEVIMARCRRAGR